MRQSKNQTVTNIRQLTQDAHGTKNGLRLKSLYRPETMIQGIHRIYCAQPILNLLFSDAERINTGALIQTNTFKSANIKPIPPDFRMRAAINQS